MSDINIPLLSKTLEWALAEWHKHLRGEISEWQQGTWQSSTSDMYLGSPEKLAAALKAGTACGTSCCIAGKVALDAGWHHAGGLGSFLTREGERQDAFSVGAELLGLTDDQAAYLFSGYNTIHSLYHRASEITDGEIQMPPELSSVPADDL